MEQGQLVRANELNQQIRGAMDQLDIEQLHGQLEELRTQSQQPDFWQDSAAAQAVMKRIAGLEVRVAPWQKLAADMADVLELFQLNDDQMVVELMNQLDSIEITFNQLKQALRFNGPYDNHNVIMNIYAGAGGTDAQDWAQLLLRMYLRWAEQAGVDTELLEESTGDEAGIKSATLRLAGPQLYGRLKGEHGVHRLVRQSPFNSAASRETSFAKVDVLPEIDQPDELKLDDKDLKIDVYRSGGHGGQSVNTTDSAVRITHLPTGITVSIQNERSQLQNKETALTILRSRLAQLQLEQHAEKISELKGENEQAAWGNQIRSYV
ncbi:MAG TPA: peptide chain release factor 2, partial [Candidatus Saccharimonadales bacterium]|nr:peptide chain release factor 2 [Candidatus Saccharimonadales bacterium]